jgi:predicted ATP-grasp superfamily ATP-dependent carboligase
VTRVLIAGFSARAAAESAANAGFAVTAVDAFADLDQHPDVRTLTMPPGTRFTAGAIARTARDVECDAVAYLANFENHPPAVQALASARTLWGNSPEVLRRVRNPVALSEALRRRGFMTPLVRLKADTTYNDDDASYVVPGFTRTKPWLLKPLASGGGRGIRPWRGDALPRGYYLQERIEGTPGSVVFVAAGGRAVPLGISRQLVGDEAFGASGFQYCGTIIGDRRFEDALMEDAAALASAAAEEFALVGVNGIDFIAHDGVPYAVEVNPRWCASMELVERVYGVSVFGAHAAACAEGRLPDPIARRGPAVVGKAIVFARADAVVDDPRGWLADRVVRDVPHPGQRIPQGSPVCSVFASGAEAAACHGALAAQARRIYSQLKS